MLRKILLVALALLYSGLAVAQQSVRQSGNVTPKHAACWVTTGIVGDCGTAAVPVMTSLGIVGQGPTFCMNSAATTVPYNRLCLGANTSSAAQITLDALGGATAQNLEFVINGNAVTFPASAAGTFIFGTPPFSVQHVPSFSTTGGVLVDSGVSATGGAITGGAWQGTAVAVAFGGTGASTAAGARGNLGLGTMSTQNSGAVAITGGTITGMPTPTASLDVANKSYVDSLAAGLSVLPSSRLATAAVLPNTPTYDNGTSGVGATLTAGSNGALSVDGTLTVVGNVILVKTQAAAAENGIYTVTAVGDGSNPYVLTRATYFDTSAEMVAGSYTLITAGSTNINAAFVLAATVATVGANEANFNTFSGAGVASFIGRTGAVVAASNDYAFSQISGTAALAQGGTGATTAANARAHLGVIPTNVVLLQGTPNNSASADWVLYGPDGSIQDISATTTCGFQEAINLAVSGVGNKMYDLYIQGGIDTDGSNAVCNIQTTVNFPPLIGFHMYANSVNFNNAGAMVGGTPMIRFDSMLITQIDFRGSQIAAGSHAAGVCAVRFLPRTLTADPAAGKVDGDSVFNASNFNSVCVDGSSGGSMINFTFNIGEMIGGDAGTVFHVTGMTGGPSFQSNKINITHLHTFSSVGIQVGDVAPSGGSDITRNTWNIQNINADGSGGTFGFVSYGSRDTGVINISDTAITTPFRFESSAANNVFIVPSSLTALSSRVDLGSNNLLIQSNVFYSSGTLQFRIDGGFQIGSPSGGAPGAGGLNFAGDIQSNGVAGVTCSGAPTGSFVSTKGIVTHC